MKKILIALALIALPMGAMAQKFAHFDSAEIIQNMDEYKKAQTDLEAMQKNYEDELSRTNEELNKKYQEYLAQADSLPKNIAERRQKEIQDMASRQEQFQQEAYNSLQNAQQEAMVPIYQKVSSAVKSIGDAGGYTYIFDISSTTIPYVGSDSKNVTAEIKTKLGIK